MYFLMLWLLNKLLWNILDYNILKPVVTHNLKKGADCYSHKKTKPFCGIVLQCNQLSMASSFTKQRDLI